MSISLNSQQEDAASHLNGPCLVVAVPGSGKSRLLVERAARILENGEKSRCLACVTFTNKAADEMKTRIQARVGSRSRGSFIGTFHSLCVSILRNFGKHLGYNRFTICSSDDQLDIIRQIARQDGYKIDKKEARTIARSVNNWRENMLDRDDYEESLYNDSFKIDLGDKYLQKIKESEIIDFSGLLSETINLLDNNEKVRNTIQDQLKYIQVDEVQDTNLAQFHLLNTFSAKHRNIMMVGDLSQSIYRFRGARYQNIKDFISQNPDIRVIELPLNYRSTPQIVEVADRLIKNNSSHMAESFITNNPDGQPVQCLTFQNDLAEAGFICSHIQKLVAAGGWGYGDIAILYRLNSMSEPIERAMKNYGIICKIIGGRSFYDRREIKDCLAMLRFKYNPRDGIAFHRIATCVSGLGDMAVGKIENFSSEEDMSILEVCSHFAKSGKTSGMRSACKKISETFDFDNRSVAAVLSDLIEKFDYEGFLAKQYSDDHTDRFNNVRQLIVSAGQYQEKNGGGIESYLAMISLMSTSDTKSDKEAVSMMTLHASKGLEFPIVFVVGAEEGILPHMMAIQEDPIEGLEEERRLCYVGMTRAEKMLYVSNCRSRGTYGRGGNMFAKQCKPSRFLIEAGLIKRE